MLLLAMSQQSQRELSIIILAILIIPIFLLMVFAIIMAFRRSRKQELERNEEVSQSTDDSQRDLFLSVYGGVDNIIEVTRQLGRISVVVEDMEKVQVEQLKELGANGVLLVNNIIKCSYGDRASYIYDILKRGKNENR